MMGTWRRRGRTAGVAAACVVALLAAGCRRTGAGHGRPWVRLDLWATKPEVEIEQADSGRRPFNRRISFLGADEVRDLAKVPAAQLAAFPRQTSGQIRALEQVGGTRLKWHVRLGEEAYVSFTPLGHEGGCTCSYRFGIRDSHGGIHELFKAEAAPVSRFAPQVQEVDLAEWAGTEVDILMQIDRPPDVVAGRPFPSVLWGSPALYGRGELPAAARRDRPNVLLIGIDTLRADRLGAWGRKPSLTPSLDRLAAESDVWLNAFSTFNATNPSFVSIMTGLYGKDHGVYDLRTALPPGAATLAERLAGAGYETMAVISVRHLKNAGLAPGFAEVTRAEEHFAGELAVDQTLDWLAGQLGRPRPFFVWLHLFDPHPPHTPPRPYAEGMRPAEAAGLAPVRAWVPFRAPGPRDFAEPILGADRDLYDGQVAYLDRQVGRLLDALASRGVLDSTVVAVVADHGESLGEHGVRYRHVGLHDTTTHVPLMIRWPRAERREPGEGGRRFSGLVQTIDLFPTLLAAAGAAVPPQDGIDLRQKGGSRPGQVEGRRVVFAEHSGKLGAMARTRDFHYIVSQGNTDVFPDGASLYDLKADALETTNLAGRGLPAERELAGLLQRWLAQRRPRAAEPRTAPLSQEDADRLKALGYAGGKGGGG